MALPLRTKSLKDKPCKTPLTVPGGQTHRDRKWAVGHGLGEGPGVRVYGGRSSHWEDEKVPGGDGGHAHCDCAGCHPAVHSTW